MIPWRSRFIAGLSGVDTWTAALPLRPWDRNVPTVGGDKISAAGVPASYIVRKDHNLIIAVRFFESEWPALERVIDWGQRAEIIEWVPDFFNTPGTSFETYLDGPKAGTPIRPTRSTEYVRAHELSIELRKVDGTPWILEWLPLTGSLPWHP
jgi:hypothetical protein